MAEVISTMVQVHIARPRSERQWEHVVLRRASDQRVFPGHWQVITGRTHENENSVTAALRELAEETGLRPRRFWTLPMVSSFYSQRRDAIVHVPVFAGIVGPSDNPTLSHEHQDFRWLDADEAVNTLVIPAQKEALRLFEQLLDYHQRDEAYNQVYEIVLTS